MKKRPAYISDISILQAHGKPIASLVESFYQALGTWAGRLEMGGHLPWFLSLDFECHGPMDKIYPTTTTKPVGLGAQVPYPKQLTE